MKKLFESKKHVTSIGAPDAKIIFSKAPFLFILPDKNFKQYIETIIISKGIFRIGIQKSRLEKTWNAGSESINVEFFLANRQFDWLEILLVYDKSNKHLTIYDSYNIVLASKTIHSVSLKNFAEAYSFTNERK